MAYMPYQYYNPYQYQQQAFTPPTIRAEIIQADNEQMIINYPVGAGQSQMFMLRDDSAIYIKSAAANGQTSIAVYQRKAQEQADPYITRAEFEQRLKEVLNNEHIRAVEQSATAKPTGGITTDKKQSE